MARQEKGTDLLEVFQEATEAGDDPLRVLMQLLLQALSRRRNVAGRVALPLSFDGLR